MNSTETLRTSTTSQRLAYFDEARDLGVILEVLHEVDFDQESSPELTLRVINTDIESGEEWTAATIILSEDVVAFLKDQMNAVSADRIINGDKPAEPKFENPFEGKSLFDEQTMEPLNIRALTNLLRIRGEGE